MRNLADDAQRRRKTLTSKQVFFFSFFTLFTVQFALSSLQEHRLDGARNEWKKFSVFSVENLKISSRHF